MIPVQKNKEYIVDIIDDGISGEGIAKIEDYTIFIKGAIKEEKVKALIIKVNKSYAYGKIVEIIKESPNRILSDCSTYKRCGGCDLRHIKYEETLLIKQKTVQNLVNKSLKNKILVEQTIGMEIPYNYRNKAIYPVGYDKNKNIIMGVFANRSHEIVNCNECLIQNKKSEEIANYIIEFMKKNKVTAYNEKDNTGLVRHIIIKIGIKTEEIMCIIVTNGDKFAKKEELVNELIQQFPNIKTIVQNINTKNTNVVLGENNKILYGNGTITDKLGEYKFEISPLSFYQVNPIQTEVLYNKAIEFANLQKQDIVMDLYCGIGTIGIFVSKYVNNVYGIEIIEQAINNANRNKQLNNIENIEFYCGEVEKTLEVILKGQKIVPNVIFVDPPRKGLDDITINNIIKSKPNKIIYISCNPATLLRDLRKLEENYYVMKIQPVDMFPFTHHVECVAVLQIKQDM